MFLYNQDMIRQAKTFSADTSLTAAQAQTEALRAIGTDGRAKLTFQLCDNLRHITMDGIRRRHPSYSARQVIQVYLQLILEKECFDQIFPDREISA